MSQKVRAAVAVEVKRTEVQEFDLPEIGPDAGLLKVEAAGVCGSDWPKYLRPDGPRILGHENVGIITKLGKIASECWGVKEGDRVAVEEYLPCRHCERCWSGEYRLCDATDTHLKTGYRYGSTPITIPPAIWGGYSQYQYLHLNSVLHKVPRDVPATEAALFIPLSNGIQWAMMEGGIGLGQTILIQGPGQMGLSCVIGAREANAGCIIVSGTSRDERRLALARELGAHYTINVDKEDLIKRVAEITRGQLADVVVDVAAGGPKVVVAAVDAAKKGGKVILAGSKGRPIPEFLSDWLIKKYLTMKGVRGHSYHAVELAIQLIASRKYPLHKFSTHQFPLSRVDEALRTVGGEGAPDSIHVTVLPWQ